MFHVSLPPMSEASRGFLITSDLKIDAIRLAENRKRLSVGTCRTWAENDVSPRRNQKWVAPYTPGSVKDVGLKKITVEYDARSEKITLSREFYFDLELSLLCGISIFSFPVQVHPFVSFSKYRVLFFLSLSSI
jgi:hypothetical protein